MSISFSVFRRFLVPVLSLVLFVHPQLGFASDLETVSFEVPAGKAFDLVVGDNTQSVSLAELEGLGMYRVVTTSPWEKGELTFEGPMLLDVVAYLGLQDAPGLLFRAVDGFVAEIPKSDWQEGPVLLATRKDGNLMSRRNQGPTRIIYPLIAHPAFADDVHKGRWIWLIADIEPSQK